MFWVVVLAFVFPILGQFGRFSLGGGAMLLQDVYIPFAIMLWAITQWKDGKNPFNTLWNYPLAKPIFLVIAVFFLSLLYNAFWFQSYAVLAEGLFYWIRYASILIFSIVVWDVFSEDQGQHYKPLIPTALATLGLVLAVLGFLQLFLYPDFAKMAEKGWDPHIGRLLSTWFDPNFLGSFFSFILIILISVLAMVFLQKAHTIADLLSLIKKERTIQFLMATVLVLLVALLLTYSRSALLAFIIPIFLIGIVYFRVLLLAGLGIILLLLPFSQRATQRISDGISSVFSIVEEQSLFMPDATARLRVENFQEGLSLGNQYFFTGIGFNVIRQYKTENIHSAGGFDSSLLTVFVTSGVFGLFSFLLLHFLAFVVVLRKTITLSLSWQKGLGVGILANFFGVFAQSFFINSLFFPFFIIFFWALIAVFLTKD